MIDSHAHLHEKIFDADRDAVLQRAAEHGVTQMVCNAVGLHDRDRLLRVTTQTPQLLPALGVHPWFWKHCDDDWQWELEQLLETHPAAAVGEIGLDRLRGGDMNTQEDFLERQLRLAAKYDRPVTLHCVRAWDRLPVVLRRVDPLPERIVLHAFSGPDDQIAEWVERDVYFSFGASVLFTNRKQPRQNAAAVPIDRLLLESDAPYLPPPEEIAEALQLTEENGRRRNEPSILTAVADEIARIRGCDREELWRRVVENSRRFWRPTVDTPPGGEGN